MVNCHIFHLLLELALGWERVISVAIGALDFAVFSVDDQFGPLVTADLATGIDSLSLGVPVAARTLTTASFYIPTTIGIRNNMMGVSCHTITPCVLRNSR